MFRQQGLDRLPVLHAACLGCSFHVLANRPDLLDGPTDGVFTHFAVEGLGLCPGLAHVTHHQQARGWLVGQHVDGSTHRIGIGVVGVIDEGHTLRGVRPPQATADRLEGSQTTHDGLGRNPQRQRAGSGCQCIAHVMTTGNVEPDVHEGLTQARAEMLGTRITGRSHGQIRRAGLQR